MTCTVQLNNVGTVFRLTIKDCDGAVVDISTATTKTIKFKQPNGTVTTKTATLTTDGTDGQLEYASEADFLNEADEWQIQARVVIGANDYQSTVSTFTVVDNL